MDGIKKEEKLGRNLSFISAFAIGTGTMIGAGIFVLPGIAITNAGPSAIFSFLLGGLLALSTALSLSELATGMPKAGGSYYFISRAMGPAFGTIVGLGAWLSLVFKGSFALIGLAEYLEIILPVPILVTAAAFGIILLLINYRGTEGSGSLQNSIVIGLFVILVLFIFRGSFFVEKQNYLPFMPKGYGSILDTTGLIFVSYLGIAKLAAISEEIKNPDKNLPRAFIWSVVSVTILYVGIMLIVNGILPLKELIGNDTPLVSVADVLAGRWGQIAIIIAGFFATVSTANAAILSSSRFPFAMGRDKLMPDSFTVVHQKHKTPYRAIIITGLTMILLLFIFNVEQLASLGSTFNVMIFVLVNMAVIILRKNKKKWYNPGFRDPFYPFSQIIGIIGSLFLIPYLGTMALQFSLGVIVLGYLWYRFFTNGREIKPQYSFFDMIENNQVSFSPAKDKKVLVSIADPTHEDDLLRLANCLGDSIIGLHVNKVPFQTELITAQELQKNNFSRNIFLEEFQNEMLSLEKEQVYLEIFSHDVPTAILEEQKSLNVNLLILGWHNGNGRNNFIGNVSSKVISHADNNIVVLKGNFNTDIRTITVPYGGGENSRYAFCLARRIALSTGAVIKLLRIINPDIIEEEKQRIISELEEETKNADHCKVIYEVKERYSPIDAIIEASERSDLMIMGDENKRFRLSLFGSLPKGVAANTKKPFILVKRYQAISREGIRSFFRKKRKMDELQ